MLGRSFFLQVLVVALFGLTLFAVLSSLALRAVGEVEYDYNYGLFSRSASLVELLIPADSAQISEQAQAVEDLAQRLEVELTLFAANAELIASSAEPAEWHASDQDVSVWEGIDSDQLWRTVLPDGRVLIVDTGSDPTLSDTQAFTFAVAVLAVVISIMLYPLTRRVTRRLETLQSEVAAIGPDSLSARVTVEGKDEIAKLAESFNKTTDRIEDLVGRQRLLLANASHELRTPLARLRMGVELIETKNSPERRDDLRKDIRELDALIDDLIAMVRFDIGGDQSTFNEVDLHAVACQEAGEIEGVEVKGGSAKLRGDARMLTHLIRNLLNNAKTHGTTPIVISTAKVGGDVILSVTDGGSGISVADQERVFEPFYRGKNTQNERGFGLGLPLVARIAKAHGATISIENEPVSTVSVIFEDDGHRLNGC